MGRMSKLEQERYGGARWALEKVTALGLEEAKKEFERRGIQNAPLNIETGEIKRFERELRNNCKRTMCALTCMVLHDEFGFGHDRLERFIRRWNFKADCLMDDLVDWPDFVAALKEECDIDVDLPIEYANHPENYTHSVEESA